MFESSVKCRTVPNTFKYEKFIIVDVPFAGFYTKQLIFYF